MMQSGRSGTARRIPGAGIINTVLAALVLPIWLLSLLAWVVQLAGVSAVQKAQGGRYLQFDWFITALEIVVLLSILPHLLVRRSTPGILALKAVVTVLEILRTNVWNDARLGRNLQGANNLRVDSITNPTLAASAARVNLLFSGYLILSAFNLLLIISLGNLPAWSGADVDWLARKGKQGADDLDERGHTGRNRTDATDTYSSGHHNTPAGTTARSTLPTGANGGAHHVPHTHLNETRQDDGLAGRTYVDRGQGATV